MATTKHLDPTNVDISIPAMTDQPNASVFSNCVDKEADAINALSDQIAKYAYVSELSDTIAPNNNGTVVIPLPSGATRLLSLIPFAFSPATSYDATIIFNTVPTLSTRTVQFFAMGSVSQKYRIFCLAIYI